MPYGLPLNETIMPEYLKTLGYSTHIIGKVGKGRQNRSKTPTDIYRYTVTANKKRFENGIMIRINVSNIPLV